ncbi:hypothetical protein [Vibrio intestinalis]|uniref:hypothetical protein n=1 Tax=Vibrio intestinalis TaxID=2933291 RepID=UPI0021A5BF12|nr:hypothetical protein [Vibrio intestinalis]
MVRFLAKIITLIIGVSLFLAYDAVYFSDWFVKHSSETIIGLFSQLPNVKAFLLQWGFFDTALLINFIQALFLAIVFSLIVSMLLSVISSLNHYAEYLIFGTFLGFAYYAIPAVIHFIESGAFGRQSLLSVQANLLLVNVLVWYLPMVVMVFFTANFKRRQFSQVERFWFR